MISYQYTPVMMALHYQILVCCGDRHPDAELYFAFIATDAIAFFQI
ncbi:hypothetical protein [Nostoc sp. 106C]|nr:hypothetical protein [Nostoc sp. 106C]